MAELQKVVVLPLQHENMGERGGADSQNQQEVNSHTDVLTRQEHKTCISSGCLEKGIPNIYGNDFQSEYKPLKRPLHTCYNFCKPAQHLSRVSL